jgi:hypothetical protein
MAVKYFKTTAMLIAVTLLFATLIIYCSDKGTEPEDDNSIKITSKVGCKDFIAGSVVIPGNGSDMDCVHYEYENNKLTVIHENAGFNCCTDFSATVQIDGDTIVITEGEQGMYCACLCLYDVEYEIAEVPCGQYLLKIVELYTHESDTILQGEIDLCEEATGQFCVQRIYYPWNIGGDPGGSLKTHSGCGGFDYGGPETLCPDDSNCIIYDYNSSTGILNLRHQNAAFNCCIEELIAGFEIGADVIIVSEDEILLHGGCDCICPYDLDMEVVDLTPGLYTFKFTSQYIWGDTVVFTADLRESPSGYFCFAEALMEL